jgi:cytochrome c556
LEAHLKKHVIPVVAVLTVVGTFSAVVYAQSADRVVKYRQGIMQAQGWHMGVLAAMAKGTRPYDKDVALKHAKFVDSLVQMPWEGFTPGSDTPSNTKAKPEIWTDKAKFDKYSQDVQALTPKLVTAAGTDLNALRTAVGDVGRACDNCHDDFRKK